MTRHTDTIEVITRDQRRRRWLATEKAALVRQTYKPDMSMSLVARQESVSASLLFTWQRLEREGALVVVSADEAVVPACELAVARAEIAKLQHVLGKKTWGTRLSRRPWRSSLQKSGLRVYPCCPETANEVRCPGAWRSAGICMSCLIAPVTGKIVAVAAYRPTMMRCCC